MSKRKLFNYIAYFTELFKLSPIISIIMFTLGILQALLKVILIFLTEYLFEEVLNFIQGNLKIDACYKLMIIIFVIMIVIQLINGLQNYFYDIYLDLAKDNLRYRLHKQVKSIKPIAFDDINFLNELERAKDGIDAAANFFIIIGDILCYYIPYFIFVCLYLSHLNTAFIILLFLIFIPTVISQVLRMKLKENFNDQMILTKRKLIHYDHCISDIKFIKDTWCLNATNYFIEKFKNSLTLYVDLSNETNRKMTIQEVIFSLFTLIGYLGILLLLIFNTMNGNLKVASFAAVYGSINSMFNIMDEVIHFHLSDVIENIPSIKIYWGFPSNEDLDYEVASQKPFKSLNLKNVSFKYTDKSKNVLSDINLQINQGERIVIVGKNGSGKTTLSKILLGLIEPTSGNILRNNQKLLFGFDGKTAIFQNFQKYKLSLTNNIRIADFKSETSINQALSTVDINGNLASLKNSILSVDYGGIDLSQGQWQKIAIARGIYRAHDFIVLDEPTSAIDPIEANAIYEIIEHITEEKTSIIITHYLGSVKFADRIIVMDKGKIIADGSHQLLLKQCILYRKMYLSQANLYQ